MYILDLTYEEIATGQQTVLTLRTGIPAIH